MHVLLVLFHAALLVVAHFQIERRVVRTEVKEIAALSMGKTVASQAFAIVRSIPFPVHVTLRY